MSPTEGGANGEEPSKGGEERMQVERRRERRVNLQAPLLIRRLGAQEATSAHEHVTQDVGLAGAYFETDAGRAYTVNEMVTASVSIPESEWRDFPFTRLAGRSRVVRVHELPAPKSEPRERIGVALEFSRDMTALTAIPMRA